MELEDDRPYKRRSYEEETGASLVIVRNYAVIWNYKFPGILQIHFYEIPNSL
jgi:hypothetical protein